MKKLYKVAILLVAMSLLATATMFVLANETDFYNESNSEELESPYVIDVTGILDHLFEPFEPIVIDASFFDTIEDYVQFREAERLMTVQAPAVEAYSRMMKHFRTTVDGYFQLVFPDNYAGAYVDYDTLVIQLTDISDEVQAFYKRLTGYDAPITFKQVEFSVNEVMDFGIQFVESIDVSIVSYGYDTMGNSLIIVLDETANESVMFYETFNLITMYTSVPVNLEMSEPINREFHDLETYIPIQPYNVQIGSLHGGTRITRSGFGNFSIGITGEIRGQSGISHGQGLLTAGHPFIGAPRGAVVTWGGREIGRLEAFSVGGRWGGEFQARSIDGDWAIIRLNHESRVGMTNRIQTGVRVNSWSNPPVGAIVRGSGQINFTFHGTVTAVNQHHPPNTNNPSDVFGVTRVQANGTSATNGDSGGSVYQQWGSVVSLSGIVTGGTSTRWYFTPIDVVRNYFFPWATNSYLTW